MGARKKYPQFDDWSAEELAGLLRICKLSAEDRQIASQCIVWHMDMIDVGAAHLSFNQGGHAAVKKLIEAYRSSEEYKRNPAYADGMLCAWEAMHSELIARTAEVRAMCEGFK